MKTGVVIEYWNDTGIIQTEEIEDHFVQAEPIKGDIVRLIDNKYYIVLRVVIDKTTIPNTLGIVVSEGRNELPSYKDLEKLADQI